MIHFPISVFFLIPFSPLIGFLVMASTPLSLFLFHIFMQLHTIDHEGLNAHKVIEKYVTDHNLSQFYESKSRDCRGFCTYDALESNRIKLEIINHAKHNVVMSGCYCGGEIFEECLSIFKKKFDENHDFKVFLICSNMWLTPANKVSIEQLKTLFPSQFFPTVTREKNLSISSDLQKVQVSCNHIKALIIDYGQYFIIGGSAIQDRWTNFTGEESLPSMNFPFYQRLTQQAVAPITFRDCDFVFSSTNAQGVGKALYAQMLKFITKWQTIYPTDHYAITELEQSDSKNPEFRPIIGFENSHDWVDGLNVHGFLSGPDCLEHKFYDSLIESIYQAKESIYINHMYFHPSKELSRSLADATKRGVKITLITNGDESDSPGLHYLYAALSKTYYKKLYKKCDKSNIDIYEFQNANVTLHKKIIVIDSQKVFTGSSNIGYTSLTASADYELDLIVDSPDFAKHTLQRNDADLLKCSKKLSQAEIEKIPFKTRLLAPLQSNFEFLL